MIKPRSEYGLLAILAATYTVVVFRFQAVPSYLFGATCVFALLYVGWGILHHVRSGSLHPRVVLEYLLVALLGVVIIATLLV